MLLIDCLVGESSVVSGHSQRSVVHGEGMWCLMEGFIKTLLKTYTIYLEKKQVCRSMSGEIEWVWLKAGRARTGGQFQTNHGFFLFSFASSWKKTSSISKHQTSKIDWWNLNGQNCLGVSLPSWPPRCDGDMNWRLLWWVCFVVTHSSCGAESDECIIVLWQPTGLWCVQFHEKFYLSLCRGNSCQ